MEAPREPLFRPVSQPLSLALVGAGIGWLVGQSASPVVAAVVASLLGIGAGAVAALQVLGPDRQASRPAIDARPAAVFVVALALAATAGMVVRAHLWLEPAAVRQAMLREAVSRPGARDTPNERPVADVHAAVLFGNQQTDCQSLLSLKGNDRAFVGELKAASPTGARLVERVPDARTLVTVVEALCEAR